MRRNVSLSIKARSPYRCIMLDAKIPGSIADAIFRALPIADEPSCFGRIVSSKNDVRIETIDPKNVVLSHIIVKSRSFDVLKASEFELVIKDMNKLRESMKLAKGSKQISIKHQKETKYITVSFGNVTRKMACASGMNFSLKNNDLSHPCSVKMKARELSLGIRAAHNVSDCMTFSASPERLEISAASQTDTVQLLIGLGTPASAEASLHEKISSSFSIEYLTKIASAFKDDDEITVSLGNDMPAKIAHTSDDNAYEVSFCIAPVIGEKTK